MWLDIQTSSNTIQIRKKFPTRFYDFVFRFFSGFLLGSALAGVYYGIDYLGKKAIGMEIGEDFWLSVLIIVGFFSVAWANISILRSTYFVFDMGAQEIKIFQKWVFRDPSSQEIPFEHIRSIEVHSGVNPSLAVVFEDTTYNLMGHISVPALNDIIDRLTKLNPPFELKKL